MAAKLTNEQRDDLAANPHQAVPVVDELANRTYYLVDEEFLLDMGDHDDAARERLRALIQQGIEGPPFLVLRGMRGFVPRFSSTLTNWYDAVDLRRMCPQRP